MTGMSERTPPLSAPPESAPIALYDRAAALLADFHGKPPPYALTRMPGEWRSENSPKKRPATPNSERGKLITDLLSRLLSDSAAEPARIHDEVRDVLSPADFVLPRLGDLPDNAERWREIGLWLCRYGSDVRPVIVGLLLLTRSGLSQDIGLVRVLGVLPRLVYVAAWVIREAGGSLDDLLTLVEQAPDRRRGGLIHLVAHSADPRSRPWLLRHAVRDVPVEPWNSRGVAERIGLAAAMAGADPDPAAVDQAVRLLASMCWDARRIPAILDYADAAEAVAGVVWHADRLIPSLPTAAALAGVLDTLCTGAAATLAWPPGTREHCVSRLLDLVSTPRWVAAVCGEKGPERGGFAGRRAAWAGEAFARARAALLDVRTAAATTDPVVQGAVNHLRLYVAARDPGQWAPAELRFLVDGFPVVAACFPCGTGRAPRLVDGLSGNAGPTTVVLAVHAARPGDAGFDTLSEDFPHAAACAGKLTVVVVRERGHVIWRDWSGVDPTRSTPPELRFDASHYDAEIARIAAEHTRG